ncbi:metallophosphoesterase family protein [Membranihabitans marinus]|uniref:metallophosphoesterase family protein n=1 Tax=Membranihabitans marinus TaxID=1227546 RepID=UPI001F19FA7A|nr:metallophosphoesterase [Membranihabitans marinus]
MERRSFVKFMVGGIVMIPNSKLLTSADKREELRFGICTDVHKDIMHDADERLQAFIDEAKEKSLDFIIQLGDFCRPYDYNLPFLSIWNQFPGDKYHVLGNHDMDGGFSREEVIQYWKAKGKYYSYDVKGYHFVVLDGNDKSEKVPNGYARYLGREQLEWLERDLAQSDLPTIVFCHQGLDNDMGGIYNGTEARLVLENANRQSSYKKVRLVFSGHHHQNYHNVINDIHYVQINSMSYHWLGGDYLQVRYSEEVDKSHPWIKYTVPYQDPIWALVEISSKGKLTIMGRESSFVGPTPEEMGVDKSRYGYPIEAKISDRKIK